MLSLYWLHDNKLIPIHAVQMDRESEMRKRTQKLDKYVKYILSIIKSSKKKFLSIQVLIDL